MFYMTICVHIWNKSIKTYMRGRHSIPNSGSLCREGKAVDWEERDDYNICSGLLFIFKNN